MTVSLKDILARRIAAQGPITVAEYMHECLLHPTMGYYTSQTPFGASGDFITAPEISQMFGELIGLCLADSWLSQGCPAPFTLAELGPGRGTLMADALRATRGVKGFHAAAQIFLIEASDHLRQQQRAALKEYAVTFASQTSDIPFQPLFAIANEFFDALPIRQFVRTDASWRERQVGLQDSRLTFGLGPEMPQPALSERLKDTKADDLVEYAPTAAICVEPLGARIRSHGGTALILDYGDWRSLGDTLQAVKNHAYVHPLTDPGACDLTAHVDFEALATAAGCAYSRLTPQGVFLERLGITQRAQQLAAGLDGNALQDHIKAHRRLTHPDEMGNLFKVLALYPDGSSPPSGLTS